MPHIPAVRASRVLSEHRTDPSEDAATERLPDIADNVKLPAHTSLKPSSLVKVTTTLDAIYESEQNLSQVHKTLP
ncbi:hypothetical protein EYF80_023395 [Liparis tanakae]|uniref:Uncharacterized protein n=1 Tax=Liparis tanakae TaxID=230148 RepID=A0A4Z2HKQ0_9TELE|nr:hypothetical protein EYF80_023395 [Liparis tanakae]